MDPRERTIGEARALDKQGRTDDAVRMLVAAGCSDEAARMLAHHGRHAEAGGVLLTGIDLGTLDAAKRKQVLLAAIYFQKAGDTRRAVDLFLGVGERMRAIEALERAGDHANAEVVRQGGTPGTSSSSSSRGTAVGGTATSAIAAQKLEAAGELERAMRTYVELKRFADAGRLALKLNRIGEAANLFATGGMPYEAAECYGRAGDTGKVLENLVRVPRDDPRYRVAATRAAKLAAELNVLDLAFESFVSKFLSTGPGSIEEAEAYLAAATLFDRHDFPQYAAEALRKIVAKDPKFRDAAAKLADIEQRLRSGNMSLEKILREEDSFRGRPRAASRPVTPPGAIPPPPPPAAPPTARPLTPPPLAPQPRPLTPPETRPESSEPTIPPDSSTMLPGEPTIPPVQRSGTLFVAGSSGSADQLNADAPAVAIFALGSTVAGRYRLERQLGVGGTSVVFKARDLELDVDVALKVFRQVTTEDSLFLGRIKQELRLSRQLSHPNIIRIYDIGDERGHRYISMELLVGGDLLVWLSENSPTMEERRDVLVQACEGLHEAHERGVVHRDVKPENVFVTKAGVVKVMDFGLAKETSHVSGLSRVGMIAGTPEYMAPEQINDFSAVSPATDVYSMGVVAYRVFTGTLPFVAKELMPLLLSHVNAAVPKPSSRLPDFPRKLEAVILRCMEKDPAKRYATAKDLADALRAAL